MRSNGPPPQPKPQPTGPQGSGGELGPSRPGGDLPAGGHPGSSDRNALFPPVLPFHQAPRGPPGDGRDGGDSGGDDDETPLGTDEDPNPPRRPKPHANPDSSGDGGGKDLCERRPVSMSINKWAKPTPNLELAGAQPSSIHSGITIFR